MSSKLIQVIHTEMPRGKGTDEDPCRIVHQFYHINGHLLAEVDSHEKDRSEILKRLDVEVANCRYWEDCHKHECKLTLKLEARVKELEAAILAAAIQSGEAAQAAPEPSAAEGSK